jgi:serine/threonine protein kinase
VVALKVRSANLSQDEAFNKRFRREAVLQATPADPHIVPVYEVGESGYGLFIAMRLVDGPSMKELIGSGGDLIDYTVARAEVAGATQALAATLDRLDSLGYQVT